MKEVITNMQLTIELIKSSKQDFTVFKSKMYSEISTEYSSNKFAPKSNCLMIESLESLAIKTGSY